LETTWRSHYFQDTQCARRQVPAVRRSPQTQHAATCGTSEYPKLNGCRWLASRPMRQAQRMSTHSFWFSSCDLRVSAESAARNRAVGAFLIVQVGRASLLAHNRTARVRAAIVAREKRLAHKSVQVGQAHHVAHERTARVDEQTVRVQAAQAAARAAPTYRGSAIRACAPPRTARVRVVYVVGDSGWCGDERFRVGTFGERAASPMNRR
jgi:hypothetical protein